LLFYLALIFQVDIYAAKRGLKGMPEEDIPSMKETLKDGWPYLFSLAMLIYMLLFMRLEAYAPYYATVVLLGISMFKRRHRLNLKRALAFILDLTTSVSNLVAILAGIGLVVGGLSYTGVAGAFSRELLLYADGSIPLMLAAGAVTSFVLGMGMTVSACYIFLSIFIGARAGQCRSESAGKPSVHTVLGHDVVHHAAGGPGGNHRCRRCRC